MADKVLRHGSIGRIVDFSTLRNFSMARLYPNYDPESITLKPERDVARALVRDLPDDCLIYHSY